MKKYEEYVAKKSAAESALTAWVQAENAETRLADVINAKKTALDKAVAEYNDLVRSDAYEALFADPNPLKAAATKYRFSGLLRVDSSRDSETKRIKKANLKISVDNDKPKYLEVYRLVDIEQKRNELVSAGAELPEVMHDPLWSAKVSKMQRMFNTAIDIADNIGKPIGPTADMIVYDADGNPIDVADMTDAQRDKISDDFSIRKGLKPCLQELLDSVIFDTTTREDGLNRYRAKEADARFVRDHAKNFNVKTHQSSDMGDAKAQELAFCFVAHAISGTPYDKMIEE